MTLLKFLRVALLPSLIRIGYVSQPNILVPLLVCNVARSEYIMSKLTRYFCKRKSFLKKAYSKAVTMIFKSHKLLLFC